MEFEGIDCCASWARTWEETRGGMLPISDHHPNCENYKKIAFFRMSSLEDISECVILPLEEIEQFLANEKETEYKISLVEMTQDQYEKLREFKG